MSQPMLSPHHRHHHPPMHLRPCLKSASPSPASSLASSPCPTPGLQQHQHHPHHRAVHFPTATEQMHRIHPAHGRHEYDRTPIAPPSEVERSCALPARGCPGKTYDPYAIDGARRTSRPAPTPIPGAPALTFSGSSSEESDEAYSVAQEHEPVPAYTSSTSPRHGSPSFHEMQFLPHAPSKQRRSSSPGRRDQVAEEERARKEMLRRQVACKVQQAQWCEWSADDDGGCLGGF